jgi:hypothetical protein
MRLITGTRPSAAHQAEKPAFATVREKTQGGTTTMRRMMSQCQIEKECIRESR